MAAAIAFLLDVDNTLLDNDRVKEHLQTTLQSTAGEETSRRFWELYEDVRSDLGAVSVPVTLERLRAESAEPGAIDALGQRLYETPFERFVCAGVPELLAWLRGHGIPVILSDGDPWFQAKKITDAGLGAGVGGNVLIFLHKQDHVEDIRRWYPAERYVAIDDKPDLLALLKGGFGSSLTTIWVRQGHYATGEIAAESGAIDFTVAAITDVQGALEQWLMD